MNLLLEVRRHPKPGLQVRENMLPHTSSHLPCVSDTLASVMPGRAPERVTEAGDGSRRLPGSQRTPCPLSLLISAVHRSHAWKNQYWQGQEKDLLRRFCHLRCLQTHSPSSSLQTLFPRHSYLLRPDFLPWAEPCVGNRGHGSSGSEASQRPLGPTPPAWLRSLKPRSKWRAQGYSARGQEDRDMNSSPRMSSPRPHIWITSCMYEWPGGLLFFPAEKGQTAQAPMFGAPLSEASACMKGV